MDIFTHALSGLALSRFSKKKVNNKLLLVFVASALSPDIDSLFMLLSGELKGHRLITHSLLFTPFLALLIALIFYFIWKRKLNFLKLYIIGVAGILIHLFLDSLLVWGVPLFYPFSSSFYSFNLYLTVIDPYIWIAYIIFILVFIFYKLKFFKLDTWRWLKLLSFFLLAIFLIRFFFYYQARLLTTLNSPIIVPINESVKSFFIQPYWKAILKNDDQFDYQIVNVFNREIVDEGVRSVYSGDMNCPKFTQEYLYVNNSRVADIRYTYDPVDDPSIPDNCVYGVKIE